MWGGTYVGGGKPPGSAWVLAWKLLSGLGCWREVDRRGKSSLNLDFVTFVLEALRKRHCSAWGAGFEKLVSSRLDVAGKRLAGLPLPRVGGGIAGPQALRPSGSLPSLLL